MVTHNASGSNLIETSATNLDLTVTNEAEFNNLIGGYREGFHKTAKGFGSEASDLGKRKREALWKDLGAALCIIEVLQRPEHAEWLFDAIDATGIPVIEDEDKQNVYVMYLRLLMGYWTEKPKGWRVGHPEPKFTWSNNVWLYASVLRGAVKRGIKGEDLFAKLKADGNLNKCKKADRQRLSEDQEEKDKKARLGAATSDKQIKASLRVSKFAKEVPKGYVALFGRLSEDGKSIEVLGLFDDKSDSVELRIQKYADKNGDKLRAEIAERERDEAKEREAALQRKLDDVATDTGTKALAAKSKSLEPAAA